MIAKVSTRCNKLGVINILIAGDNPIELLGLRALLESEPNFKVVGEASDGLEAIQLVQQLSLDVVILGSMMIPMNGIEAARQIRAQFPQIRIVILSAFESEAQKIETTNNNAYEYVLKQSSTQDLVIAIHEILAGRHFVNPPLNDRTINSDVQSASSIKEAEPDPYASLTPREQKIFILIIQGNTNHDIAQKLFISERTIESHRANMMHKLGIKSHIHLVRFAIEHGLIPKKEN